MLKSTYGNRQAITNKTTPKPNLVLLSSSEPEITIIIAKNPKITGIICENKVVPITAILNHYYNLLIFKLFKHNLILLNFYIFNIN